MIARDWKRDSAVILLIGAALTLALPGLVAPYTLTLLVIYGMLAFSLGLIWGFGGVLCFGQAAFFGLGAYGYAIAAINFDDSTLAMLLAVAVPALFALALGALIFYGRLTDVYLAVITLVVSLILFRYISSTAGPDYRIGTARLGGFNGIPGFPTLTVPGRPDLFIWGDALYYLAAVLLILVVLLVSWLLRSSFGRVAVGIRENEQRVSLLGYDVRARKTALFAIGAAIAGLAGGLYANWAEIVTPSLFALGLSAEIIIWCIVGGLGTRFGPILGAAGLAYLKFLLGQQSLLDNMLVMGVVLVLFVLFLPHGLAPEIARLWRWLTGSGRRRSRRPAHRRPQRAAAGDLPHG